MVMLVRLPLATRVSWSGRCCPNRRRAGRRRPGATTYCSKRNRAIPLGVRKRVRRSSMPEPSRFVAG